MLNEIILMGRLTRDPEIRYTNSGIPVASFTIAVDRDFKKDGESETDFIDITAWRNTAEFVSKHFSKGRMAVVSGRLQIRTWNDKDGNKRRNAEVVAENVYFGDSKKDEGGNSYSVPQFPDPANCNPTGHAPIVWDAPQPQDYAVIEGDDSELPF